MELKRDVIILGAGLAGLTFASELNSEISSVIIEKLPAYGGLSRTIRHHDYLFDLGGHRFHSQWPEIYTYVNTLLGKSKLIVDRKSRIHINNRYVNYPLELPNALQALNFGDIVKVIISLLIQKIKNRSGSDVSFEDWVVKRYGAVLYNIYFKPYTEKVLGMDCTEISSDWAEQRVKLPSLITTIMKSLFPPKNQNASLISTFIYPKYGIGEICDLLVKNLAPNSAECLQLNSKITRIQYDPNQHLWLVDFINKGRVNRVSGHHLVSTIPWDDLANLLNDEALQETAKRFHYRDLMCVFLGLDQDQVSRDTWTYFPDKEIIFGRSHEPKNWSQNLTPEGKSSLVLEIFCSKGDEVWKQSNDTIIQKTITDLVNLGVITNETVLTTHLVRVRNAYPIYHVGYRSHRNEFRERCLTFPHIHLLGRTGNFNYLNMDAVIKESLELAGKINNLTTIN